MVRLGGCAGSAVKGAVFLRNNKTRFLVYSGLLLAAAVLLSFFSIYLGPSLKISLAPAAVIYAGILLGPFTGAAVGAASDVLVLLLKSLPGAYFPGFTATMALYGLLGGLLYRSHDRQPGLLNVILSTAGIQLICSMLLNTAWLTILTGTPYGTLLATRLPVTAVSDVIYTVLLAVLVRYQKKILPNPPRPTAVC